MNEPEDIETLPVISNFNITEEGAGNGALKASLVISSDSALDRVRIHCSSNRSVDTSSSSNYQFKDSNNSTENQTILPQDDHWVGQRIYCKPEVLDIKGGKALFSIKSVQLSSKDLIAPNLDGGAHIQSIMGGFQINSREATGDVDEYRFYRSTSSGGRGNHMAE